MAVNAVPVGLDLPAMKPAVREHLVSAAVANARARMAEAATRHQEIALSRQASLAKRLKMVVRPDISVRNVIKDVLSTVPPASVTASSATASVPRACLAPRATSLAPLGRGAQTALSAASVEKSIQTIAIERLVPASVNRDIKGTSVKLTVPRDSMVPGARTIVLVEPRELVNQSLEPVCTSARQDGSASHVTSHVHRVISDATVSRSANALEASAIRRLEPASVTPAKWEISVNWAVLNFVGGLVARRFVSAVTHLIAISSQGSASVFQDGLMQPAAQSALRVAMVTSAYFSAVVRMLPSAVRSMESAIV